MVRDSGHALNLKMDPIWPNVFGGGEFKPGEQSQLSTDRHDSVTVPTLNLVVASPLIRAMVEHLHHAGFSYVFSFPEVSREALLCAGQILTKGVASVKGEDLVLEVQEFFKTFCVDLTFSASEVNRTVTNDEDPDEDIFCEEFEKDYYWDGTEYFKVPETEEEINVQKQAYTWFRNDENVEKKNKTREWKNLDPDEELFYNTSSNEKNSEIMKAEFDEGKIDGNETDKTKFGPFRHSSELLQFPFCDNMDRNKNDVSKHVMNHTAKKAFACDQCDFRTTKSWILVTHQMRHSGEKPFKCDQCTFQTRHSVALMRHKRRHSVEKSSVFDQSPKLIKCSFCDFKFRGEAQFSRHVRKHTGEKPFECDQCDFKTAHSKNLVAHKMGHSGEKPFKCDQCSFQTRHSRSLTEHKRGHNGEKPFDCKICGYETAFAGNLRKHKKKVHYACNICDYKTVFSRNLVRHKKLPHIH